MNNVSRETLKNYNNKNPLLVIFILKPGFINIVSRETFKTLRN